jgi:hypothetical protein
LTKVLRLCQQCQELDDISEEIPARVDNSVVKDENFLKMDRASKSCSVWLKI